MTLIVGTCSRCRGPVQQPTTWFGSVPPLPSCARCGAVPVSPYGPLIECEPERKADQPRASGD